MCKAALLKCAVAAIFALSLVGEPASAALGPVAQETGKISISVDGIGTNAASGIVQVEKPAGATVRIAVFSCASYSFRIIEDEDVAIDGIGISWDTTDFNNSGTTADFFHNTLADVTGVVKTKIDAAPAGRINFAITEVDTNTIDGCILAVIFDDPGQTVDHTAIVLFGGQSTLGDTTIVALADPIDKGDPNLVLDFGLGISFGAQDQTGFGGSHLCGTESPMFSLIDINSSRLTSCAGNLDDAPITEPVANGSLITVGGLDDTNINPADPFQQAADGQLLRVEDDELYDLIPFVSTGDTAIVVDTLNPSDDDNIFFAYVFTSVPSAVLPDVPPPGPTIMVGNIDRNLPTIVLTHGLQPQGDTESEEIADLWTGIDIKQAATLIRNDLGVDADQVNIVQYIWRDAFQPFGCVFGFIGLPNSNAYKTAQSNVKDAAARLAQELFLALGDLYDKPIHFIGHSLGTAVNAYAASALLNELPRVEQAQFTALDRPDRIFPEICGISITEARLFGFDENFFGTVLRDARVGRDLRIDNYYSLGGAGVGDVANGHFVYNHAQLEDPNDVGGRYFEEESAFLIDNNHSGVHQWYRWTIDPNAAVFTVENLFNQDNCNNGSWTKPITFDQSLNPCQQGWHWALNRNPNSPAFADFPKFNADPLKKSSESPLVLTESREFGCTFGVVAGVTRIICTEASSPFIIATVDIPDDAEFVSFEYAFTNIGDGDYAAVLLDDIPIWVLSGESVMEEGEFFDSGPIPIGDLTGLRRLTVALYGVGEPNAEFEVRNFGTFSVVSGIGVDLDIKPNKEPNPINLRSRDVIPVAILTTESFDATMVDPLTVEFGPDGAFEAHGRGHIKDVDGDSDLDLVLHFAVQETGISCGDTSASLTGETFGGEAIEGSDSIKTVGCK